MKRKDEEQKLKCLYCWCFLCSSLLPVMKYESLTSWEDFFLAEVSLCDDDDDDDDDADEEEGEHNQ